jgi:uncharacterized protein
MRLVDGVGSSADSLDAMIYPESRSQIPFVLILAFLTACAHGSTATGRPRCGSVEACTSSCDRGDGRACVELGERYSTDGDSRDPHQATLSYDKACTAGDAAGCWLLAHALATPSGTKRDKPRALALAERACKAGSPEACAFLADEKGSPTGPEAGQARALWEKACQQGEAAACSQAADLHDRGHVGEASAATAISLWKRAFDLSVPACAAGDAGACERAATLLEMGRVGPRDKTRATQLQSRACDLGSAASCMSVAFQHEKAGERAQSIALREKACALGQAVACELIERLLRAGALDPAQRDAVVAAQARGRRLAERTCDRGDWIACVDWARLNKKSPSVAQTFSQRACDAGLADGCAVLSNLYTDSIEPGAEEREMEVLRRACELDAPDACAAAARLEGVRAGDEPPRGTAEARASRLREAEALQRRAFELRRHGCDLDDGDDCFELAKMQAAGEGTAKDEALAKQSAGRALRLLAAKCEREQQLDTSCMAAGDGYASRRWGLLDGSRVAALYQLACAEDEGIECKFLADLYREGSLVPRDDDRARSLLAKACGLGDLDACTTGEAMTKDLPAGDPYRERLKAARSRERSRLRDACADGNLLRCLALGRELEKDGPGQATAMYQRVCDADEAMCYHLGASLAKAHPQQALAAFTRDCKGFGPACERAAELAVTLHKPELAVPLRQRAADFLVRGCRHGNSSNCFKLAKPPRKPGESVPDPAFARRATELGLHFAEIACDRGETSECGDAADALMKPPGDRDAKRAAALYAKGCQWGEALACSSLADMLHSGDGVRRDEKRADELYQQACKLGEESSCNPHPEEDESDGD